MKTRTRDDTALRDRPHGSEMMIQQSNRWRDLPVLADNNQMVFRMKWNEFRRYRGISLSAAESCWVQARRVWQLLVILARGKGGTRASLVRHSYPTCLAAPSRPRPWDSRSCVRTDSSRSRQSNHRPVLVWENKSWVIRTVQLLPSPLPPLLPLLIPFVPSSVTIEFEVRSWIQTWTLTSSLTHNTYTNTNPDVILDIGINIVTTCNMTSV